MANSPTEFRALAHGQVRFRNANNWYPCYSGSQLALHTHEQYDVLQIDLLRKPNLIAAVEGNGLSLRSSTLMFVPLEQPLAAKIKLKCGDRRWVKLPHPRLSGARRTRWEDILHRRLNGLR